MKKLFLTSALCVVPMLTMAAGTYYTGGYQSPQQNYARPGYVNTSVRPAATATPNYSTSGYSRYGNQVIAQNVTQQQVPQNTPQAINQSHQGFYLNAGASYQNATWGFDMNDAGSKLHYDNINWYVFDFDAGYRFGSGGSIGFEIFAGAKIGMQGSDGTMVDDDITNGGYELAQVIGDDNQVIGYEMGNALSIGTSGGGSMFGYHAGVGLTDVFKIGNLKITPSIGWRSLSYTLETKNNHGLSVDTAACFTVAGETQCDPAMIVIYENGTQHLIWRGNPDEPMQIGDGAEILNTGGTYKFSQPDTSHSYEVDWSGPYIALDARYDININNYIDAHVELGLPGYSATGDQPYRFDWAHPKSVEDSADMFSGFSLGLGFDWNTAITNSIMLSIGLTYDYYSISGAQAKTYLNGNYYNELYSWAGEIIENSTDPADIAYAEAVQGDIGDTRAACPGWVCTADNEIESFYKSLGVRVGFAARF